MSFLKQLFNTLQPDKFFLICASVFGLIFWVLIPPFQTPDEINHFYRSYEIADGHLLGQRQNNRVGGEIPQSLCTLAGDFKTLAWESDERIDGKTIFRRFNIPLKPENTKFVNFLNTAMYSQFIC